MGSEIYVDKESSWHRDALYGALQLYNTELDLFRSACRSGGRVLNRSCTYGLGTPFWEPTRSNTPHEITTVGVYLQDHRQPPSQALAVQPRSHHQEHALLKVTDKDRGMELSYGIGDAVVFDARLLHRGADKAHGNRQWDLSSDRQHRAMISLSIGSRNNAISDTFDRGFAFRARLHTYNSSICRAERTSPSTDISPFHRCAQEAVRADLAALRAANAPMAVTAHTPNMRDVPTTPLAIGLESADDACELIGQSSAAVDCVRGKTFGCERVTARGQVRHDDADAVATRMWVEGCRGSFLCNGTTVQCAYFGPRKHYCKC